MPAARDQFAPRFEIYVNNVKIPDEMKPFVNKITVKDEMDLFDEIVLNVGGLQVTDRGQQTDLVNSKYFFLGGLLRIDMGYGNALVTVGGGEIVKINPKFNRNGISLEIIAYDAFFRLQQTKHRKAKNFPQKFSGVVKEVLSTHEKVGIVTIDVKPENDIKKEKGYVQTVGTNDYEFLKKFANIRGFDFFNRFNALTQKFDFFLLEPLEAEEPKLTFSYFEHEEDPLTTLLDFGVEVNLVDQITDLEIASFNRKIKKKITTFIQIANKKTGKNDLRFKGPDAGKALKEADPVEVRFKTFGQNFQVISNAAFDDEKEAKVFATMWLRENVRNFITGSGTTVGVEILKSREVVEFLGLGNFYSGNWFLNSVIHEMIDGSVYISKVDGRKLQRES